MAKLDTLEMRAAEDRVRLKLALEALGGSTKGGAMAAPLASVAQTQASRVSRGVLGAARQNPTAAALIGLGLGCFATGRGGHSDADEKTGTALPAGALALGAGAAIAALWTARRSAKPSK